MPLLLQAYSWLYQRVEINYQDLQAAFVKTTKVWSLRLRLIYLGTEHPHRVMVDTDLRQKKLFVKKIPVIDIVGDHMPCSLLVGTGCQ